MHYYRILSQKRLEEAARDDSNRKLAALRRPAEQEALIQFAQDIFGEKEEEDFIQVLGKTIAKNLIHIDIAIYVLIHIEIANGCNLYVCF